MVRSGIRSQAQRILLCAGDREPDLPLVDLGRLALRGRAQSQPAKDDPGTRLHLSDLVRPDQGELKKGQAGQHEPAGARMNLRAVLSRAVREPLLHFLAIGAALFAANSLINGPERNPTSSSITITQGQVNQLIESYFL